MRFIKISSLCLFVLWAVTSSSWAQYDAEDVSSSEARSLSNPEWQATLDMITRQTKELLKENEKLNSEHEFLQEKVSGLKASLEKTKAEIKQLQSQKTKAGTVSPKVAVSDASDKMSDLQKEIDDLSAENKDLEKELTEIKEKNRLWKIQVASLQNQKRDTRLDANYEEARGSGFEAGTQYPSSDLQRQLDKSLQNEKDLAEALEKITAQNEDYPEEEAVLKKKTRDLEDRVKMLRKDIAAQQQQNEKLKKSAKKGKGATSGASVDLVKQKKLLESDVVKLTAQLDAVSKTVGESKEVLGKKRQLMNQIMHLDAENQELRGKIDALVADSAPR